MFGDNRIKLTSTDWNKAFPSNGYWTTKLKNYLANHIAYNVDWGNIKQFTLYFIDENQSELTGGRYVWSGTAGNHSNQEEFDAIVSSFYNKLQTEASSSNGATVSGVPNSNNTTLLTTGTTVTNGSKSTNKNVYIYSGVGLAVLIIVGVFIYK